MSHIKGATIGMFDGVHRGHQYLISQLKTHCDEPIVVTFANHPLWEITGKQQPKLLSTTDEKTASLKAAGVTPVILQFDRELRKLTAEDFIKKLCREHGITRLILGFNNSIGSDRCSSDADLRRVAEATGVDIIRASELPGEMKVNSSAIRELINIGATDTAASMLGKPYTLSGPVVHGKHLGRTIGFPTANIEVADCNKLIPANGVYAANAITCDNRTYRALVNIGHCPTVDKDSAKVTIEACLNDFTGNLYGQNITLQFIKRLRGEKKFNSIEELRQQIAADFRSAL